MFTKTTHAVYKKCKIFNQLFWLIPLFNLHSCKKEIPFNYIFDEKIELISYQLLFLTYLYFPCAHDLKHSLNRNYWLDIGIENNCVFRKSM